MVGLEKQSGGCRSAADDRKTFAGTGTRNHTEDGRQAILDLCKKTSQARQTFENQFSVNTLAGGSRSPFGSRAHHFPINPLPAPVCDPFPNCFLTNLTANAMKTLNCLQRMNQI